MALSLSLLLTLFFVSLYDRSGSRSNIRRKSHTAPVWSLQTDLNPHKNFQWLSQIASATFRFPSLTYLLGWVHGTHSRYRRAHFSYNIIVIIIFYSRCPLRNAGVLFFSIFNFMGEKKFCGNFSTQCIFRYNLYSRSLYTFTARVNAVSAHSEEYDFELNTVVGMWSNYELYATSEFPLLTIFYAHNFSL